MADNSPPRGSSRERSIQPYNPRFSKTISSRRRPSAVAALTPPQSSRCRNPHAAAELPLPQPSCRCRASATARLPCSISPARSITSTGGLRPAHREARTPDPAPTLAPIRADTGAAPAPTPAPPCPSRSKEPGTPIPAPSCMTLHQPDGHNSDFLQVEKKLRMHL